MTDKFEEGYELYLRDPDLMLVEVWHWTLPTWSRSEREDFVMGYIAMRHRRDEREQESLCRKPHG